MLSENFMIDGREYNFDYKEQELAHRTLIVISSEFWDEQDMKMVERLRELLAVRLKVTNNPNLPRMVFVQTKKPDGTLVIVPIAEVKDIVKSCIAEF